ncbi:GNAT family N-acetyltransferase [Allobranchiibius huperziae]|uniref:Ribosomal protein S18 acetylase RimI-like enzyme n=1 Tax=Allobranchiibius huperziae TaxID=1874116 RepID=A0A853DHR5_9MICO|nr:GNAT family N-acetyltransferase [Allobranchiibius huperziae]NYJ75563.1 ribosomal protein S18 acetylase RimI-like enzyme [Allobranchiibius huperziae]
MPEPPNQPDLTRTLTVGMRVVLRHRLDGGLTDALGPLVSADDTTLVVQTRRGRVTVARVDVVAAKEVPPAAVRRGAPHLAPSMADLQELMVAGMPPLRSEWLGRWLLREASGYTGRANSVLPLGDPGVPLSDALAFVASWYADRGGVPLLQVYGPSGFSVADDAVGGAAIDAGWTAFQRTLVMTGSVDALAVGGGSSTATVADRPDDAWWSGAAPREQEHRATATAIFDQIPDAAYLTLRADAIRPEVSGGADAGRPEVTAGEVVAVGRTAFAHAWAGVLSVHVPPAYRRRGLARQVMTLAAREARARGIRSMYLQVSQDNTPAVQLYESLGFAIHHEYYYLRAPTAPRAARAARAPR